MNKTREQWAKIDPLHIVRTCSETHIFCLICDAQSDIVALYADLDRLADQANQQDVVMVPRELLEGVMFEAGNLLDSVNDLLQYAGSTGDDMKHGAFVERLRALLGGGV